MITLNDAASEKLTGWNIVCWWFGLGLKPNAYSCTVTRRGTPCSWEDLLEKRATKEKQSVNTWMGRKCVPPQFGSYILHACLLWLFKIQLLFDFRVTGDSKVSREKRGWKVKRGLRGNRYFFFFFTENRLLTEGDVTVVFRKSLWWLSQLISWYYTLMTIWHFQKCVLGLIRLWNKVKLNISVKVIALNKHINQDHWTWKSK